MMSKEKMLEYLRQLGAELSKREMKGEILLTAGAVMCLVYSMRDMTKDVYALYEPKSVINEIAAGIAEREGLASDWLNEGVKGFVGDDAPSEVFLTFDGLRVQTVSDKHLLAMKLISTKYDGGIGDEQVTLFDDVDFDDKEQSKKFLGGLEKKQKIVEKALSIVRKELEESRSELARHERECNNLSLSLIAEVFAIYLNKRSCVEVKDGVVCVCSKTIETDSKLSEDAKLSQLFDTIRSDAEIDMTLYPIICCDSREHWYWIKSDINGDYANRESLGEGLSQELAIRQVKKMTSL